MKLVYLFATINRSRGTYVEMLNAGTEPITVATIDFG